MEVRGRDMISGLPRKTVVTSEEIREALQEPLSAIINTVTRTLERAEPELAADLVDNGIVLAGGGALLRGIDRVIAWAGEIHAGTGLPFALWQILDDPAIILKKELAFLPFFGWYAMKLKNIKVDRAAASKALRDMLKQARQRAGEGRQVVIFPQGTRLKPGEAESYKPGVAGLYAAMKVPCTPVALNSGLYWPPRGFVRRPGTIVIEFLPAIEPGLPRDQFMAELEARIETASAALPPAPDQKDAA